MDRKKWKLILIGGGSLHVQEILDRLEEFNCPIDKIQILSEGARQGEIHEFQSAPILIGRLQDIPEEDYDVAVLLEPVKDLEKLTKILVKGNIALLDASGSFAGNESVPVVVPEYWDKKKKKFPLIGAIPATLSLSLCLIIKPLIVKYGLNSILLSCIQSVSQIGSKGALDELFDQIRAILNFQDVKFKDLPKQIAFNGTPVDKNPDFTNRIHSELSAFLGHSSFDLDVDLNWGCFFIGITGVVWLRTDKPFELSDIQTLLENAPSIHMVRGNASVGILDAASQDKLFISDLRVFSTDRQSLTLRFTLDNLRKGLSTNIVQTLELIR